MIEAQEGQINGTLNVLEENTLAQCLTDVSQTLSMVSPATPTQCNAKLAPQCQLFTLENIIFRN